MMELRAEDEFKTIATRKAYQSDLAYIRQWGHVSFGGIRFPIEEHAVLLFITDHLQGMPKAKEKQLMSVLLTKGYKAKPGLHTLATVRRRLFALTAYHKEQGYGDPCASSRIKQQLQEMAKTEEKAAPQKAITEDILEKLLATCDGSVKGIRDKAILLLAWASGGRRSELVTAQVEHLTSQDHHILPCICGNNTKADFAIDEPLKTKVVQALQEWMTLAGIEEGIIFRAVGKGGKVSNKPLSPIDVNRIVKSHSKAAGLEAKQFGAHSLRRGFLLLKSRPRKNSQPGAYKYGDVQGFIGD